LRIDGHVHLRQTLTDILSGLPSPNRVRLAVVQFQQIAAASIQSKVRLGSLWTAPLGLAVEDIAIDCIAPLFARDAQGRFSVLHAYYGRLDWEKMSEEELLSYTRRLVFSSVNQGLVKLWKQTDPSLEKLLRNLTAAIRASDRLEIRARMGHNHVLLKSAGPSGVEREEMTQEYLEAMLSQYVREGFSMKGTVDAVVKLLEEQEVYRREVSLVRLGIAIRAVCARSALPLEEPPCSKDGGLLDQEIASSIRMSVSQIRERMEKAYVARGKTDIETYSRYFEAISQSLLARYADQDGEGLSLFSSLALMIPGLTFEAYKGEHRAILEYLFRLTESEFLGSIKGEL
jgi:hypothetical protein